MVEKRRRILIAGLAIFLLLVASAFALRSFFKKNFKAPVVTGTTTEYVIQGNSESKAVATLRIYNPNDFSVRADSFSYRLLLDGKEYLSGSSTDSFTLREHDTSSLSLPFTFKTAEFKKDLSDQDSALQRFETVSYIHLWKNKNIKVPYTIEKKHPLFKGLTAKMTGADVRSFGLHGLKVDATFNINNPNMIDLTTENTRYELIVGGETWAEGALEQTVHLPKKTTKTLSFPIELKMKEAVKNAGLFVSGKKDKPYTFTLKTTFQLGNLPVENNQIQIKDEGTFGDLIHPQKKN